MYRALVHSGFFPVYLLLLFFGLGPVMLADGTRTERALTLLAVLAAALLLAAAHRWLYRRLQ